LPVRASASTLNTAHAANARHAIRHRPARHRMANSLELIMAAWD
jgi:hypothetical protein